MNQHDTTSLEAGTALVTRMGIEFLGKKYTGRTPLLEHWYEQALAVGNRDVPVLYHPIGMELYICSGDDYEQLRELPVYTVTEEQRELYYTGIRQLKERWQETKSHGHG